MAISSSSVVRLTFNTAGEKTYGISLPSPRTDLEPSEVVSVMDAIIAGNVFNTASGALTGIQNVKIVDTTNNDLYDPAKA
ncbi:MAG: DUF2922 domain-containing protein [Peptococcaceae bacterium]|nr:DUF2922 domain-containing protein [Peptococcaceae bacterium]